MTFDRARVRQLSKALAVKLALVPGDHESYNGDVVLIEAAILAAARELLGEASLEMQTAGYKVACGADWPNNWSDGGVTPELYIAREGWKAMAAARLAQLGEK